jgi:hypothetical protein
LKNYYLQGISAESPQRPVAAVARTVRHRRMHVCLADVKVSAIVGACA